MIPILLQQMFSPTIHKTWINWSNTVNFLFGPEKLKYQSEANGVVGGGLGWYDLLKSQHVYAEFSAYRFWDFSKLFTIYHKLKNCCNSLVYGIDVAGFSVYLLNYQHCWKCVLKIQHRCAGISAQRTIPTPHQPPQIHYFDISILEYQKEILKMKLCCHIGLRFFHQIIRFLASQVRIMWFSIRLLTLTLQCLLGDHTRISCLLTLWVFLLVKEEPLMAVPAVSHTQVVVWNYLEDSIFVKQLWKTAVWMLWGSIFQWADFEDTHA